MDAETTPNPAQPKSRRRWYQFGLRTLLIVVTLAGCGFGWLGWKVREAQQQEAAVAAIEKLGDGVFYDYQLDSDDKIDPNAAPPGPAWLHSFLGDDFFRSVAAVGLENSSAEDADMEYVQGLKKLRVLWLDRTKVSDSGLARLSGLTRLGYLHLVRTQVTDAGLANLTRLVQLKMLDLNDCQVTDAGLEHLKELTRLEWLYLARTKVTDAGVKRLQQALPNCHIVR